VIIPVDYRLGAFRLQHTLHVIDTSAAYSEDLILSLEVIVIYC